MHRVDRTLTLFIFRNTTTAISITKAWRGTSGLQDGEIRIGMELSELDSLPNASSGSTLCNEKLSPHGLPMATTLCHYSVVEIVVLMSVLLSS